MSDIAGRSYWDGTYADGALGAPFSPAGTTARTYGRRALHRQFQKAFAGLDTRNSRLLECGCGRSTYLSYFAREYGFSVSGIDYSDGGCELARRMLERDGVPGEIACADFFSPPESMHGRFDVVTSFGVIEHFDDPAGCLRAFARLLKPGGMILTSVPNMAGLVGGLQKIVARDVYNKHVVIDLPALRSAHERAGFVVRSADYFLFVNMGVVNTNQPGSSGLGRKLRSLIRYGVLGATGVIWALENKVHSLPPNRLTSPYILCVADWPGSASSGT